MSVSPPHRKSAESSDSSSGDIQQLGKNDEGVSQDTKPGAITTHETTQSDGPPDGGVQAWCQVLAGHLVLFNTSGYILSFGIFQPHYVNTMNVETSAIAWIGSIQICFGFLVGGASGWAFDAGHCMAVLATGSVLQVAGILATSWSREYWQVFLAQGVCSGLGAGIIFAPGLANVATYFARRRSLAISVATCGATTGGIVFSLMARQLLPKIGFGWTVRAMGLVVLVNAVLICVLTKPRLAPRKSGPMMDMDAFKDRAYLLFSLSMFLAIWVAYFAYFYVRQYALNILGVSESTSYDMLLVVSAVGYFGRIIPALIADRLFGAINTFIPILFGMAICMFAWMGVHSVASDYVWLCAFGFLSAAVQTMFPSTLAFLAKKDLSKAGTRIGMVFTFVSVPALTGPPLAGKLVAVCNGDYWGLQVWAGTSMLVGAVLLVATSYANRGPGVRLAPSKEAC